MPNQQVEGGVWAGGRKKGKFRGPAKHAGHDKPTWDSLRSSLGTESTKWPQPEIFYGLNENLLKEYTSLHCPRLLPTPPKLWKVTVYMNYRLNCGGMMVCVEWISILATYKNHQKQRFCTLFPALSNYTKILAKSSAAVVYDNSLLPLTILDMDH